MKNNIKQVAKKIYPIFRRYGVKRAAIFGSFAAGKNKRASDIDILVKFAGRKSLFDLSGLKIELEEILKKKVDVLTYNSLHPLIRRGILKEQKVIL